MFEDAAVSWQQPKSSTTTKSTPAAAWRSRTAWRCTTDKVSASHRYYRAGNVSFLPGSRHPLCVDEVVVVVCVCVFVRCVPFSLRFSLRGLRFLQWMQLNVVYWFSNSRCRVLWRRLPFFAPTEDCFTLYLVFFLDLCFCYTYGIKITLFCYVTVKFNSSDINLESVPLNMK